MNVSSASGFVRRYGVALVVAIILIIYGFEAHALYQAAALPAQRADQAAYLQYAQHMRESGYSFEGDRNRMPVFPFLLSGLYRAGMNESTFLAKARIFNVYLTIVLLLATFLIFRKFFPSFYSIALLVATAFGVFIYRAGIVAAEPLFYVSSFISFICLWRMLVAPNFFLALATGVVSGIAFLTKASALAALPIWAVLFFIQAFVVAWSKSGFASAELNRRSGLLGIVTASFILCVLPYIWTSKQRYGEFFYNVNSAHYMWCDSWPEALSYSETLRTPATRRSSIDELPSFKKYSRTHSVGQAFDRLFRGLKSISKRGFKPVGYYKFVAFLNLAALTLIFLDRRSFVARIRSNLFPAIFCLLFLATYVLLYAWYGAVITDSRFILALFLPFVFCASMVIQALAGERMFVIGSFKYPVIGAVGAALAGFGLIDVLYNINRIIVKSPGVF